MIGLHHSELQNKMSRHFLTIVLAVIVIGYVGCVPDPYQQQRTDAENEVGNAQAFILAIASEDESGAQARMSIEARSAVTRYCDKGTIIACFDKLGRRQWGKFKTLFFEFGTKEGASAFSTLWENRNILIVIQSKKESGRWVVDGWRGVISGKNGWPDGLVEGTNPINQFPPPLATPTP